jgi:hypothetical protein
MIKNKFDLIFESIMEEITDAEMFGTDSINSILKVYKWDRGTKDFSDIDMEIDNFKFNPEKTSSTNDYLADLTVDDNEPFLNGNESLDLIDNVYKNIVIFDKNTNKILWHCFTRSENVQEIIDSISFNVNSEITEESVEDDFESSERAEYEGYTIWVNPWNDQGDTVYGFEITKNDEVIGDSYESKPNGYPTAEVAVDHAKMFITDLEGKTVTVNNVEKHCPYCKRKINKIGTFYYSCINCGKIHKNYVEK